MSKVHHSFPSGTITANLTDLCIANMEIGGILINEATRDIYVRTKISNPSVASDWTLLGSSGGADKYIDQAYFVNSTNIFRIVRSDGAIFNTDLSALKDTLSSNIIFSNAGTNFTATTVEAAIKELNSNRPFGKIGSTTQLTTNKPVTLNDPIYHNNKLHVNGYGTDSSIFKVVNGNISTGWQNTLGSQSVTGSAIIGGDTNQITSAIDSSNNTQTGTLIAVSNQVLHNSGHRTAIINSRIISNTGAKVTIIDSENIINNGDNNIVIDGNTVQITGTNNVLLDVNNIVLNGTNNKIFSASNIAQFDASGSNILLGAYNLEQIYGANGNVTLYLQGGALRSNRNLVWGKNLYADGGFNEDIYNILLGQNINAYGKNSFIWSASLQGASVSAPPVDISYDNVFVLVDGSSNSPFDAINDNTFNARFAGGFALRSNSAGTVGVNLAAGGSSWSSVSSIRTKDIVSDIIDIENVINRFNDIEFKIYKYKDDETNTHFLSTTAEEWNTVLENVTHESISVNGENIPAIRTNDQISLALMLIQDIYRKLELLNVN